LELRELKSDELSQNAPVRLGPIGRNNEHVFVNDIRHWSMVAVVFIHCSEASVSAALELPFQTEVLTQVAKFGTIGFFLISGFLLGERIDSKNQFPYLVRRVRRLLVPWLAWFGFYCCFLLAGHSIHHRVLPTLAETLHVLRAMFVGSAYWFVPNMIVALVILLGFSRLIQDWRFGTCLLAAALFYGINIYFHWAPSLHTSAVVGFVGYLWLGAWCGQNWTRVGEFIFNLPLKLVVFAALGALAMALGEASVLRSRQYPDPLNTLRISNQLFSILMVLILVRFPLGTWPRFINPREHTFGIYLTHSPILLVFSSLRVYFIPSNIYASGIGQLCLALAIFLSTYITSVVLSRALAWHPRLSWTVGARRIPPTVSPFVPTVTSSRRTSKLGVTNPRVDSLQT
jgi:acyltransferase